MCGICMRDFQIHCVKCYRTFKSNQMYDFNTKTPLYMVKGEIHCEECFRKACYI